MDKNIEKIAALIDDYLEFDFLDLSIERLRNVVQLQKSVDIDDKYIKYSIRDFLTIYKIEELLEKEVISKDVAVKLKDLVDEKRDIKRKISGVKYQELFEDVAPTDSIYKLHSRKKEIDESLKKYGLLPKEKKISRAISGIVTEEHMVKGKRKVKKLFNN